MTQKTFNIGYAIAAIFLVFMIQYAVSVANQIAPIPYSDFQRLLHEGKIASVGVSDRFIQGSLKEPLPGGQKQFLTTRVDPQFAGELDKYGVRYTGEIESTFLRELLSWIMPMLLFVGLWWYLGRRFAESQGFGGGLMSIGKSKAKIYVESDTGVTFDDVAGVDEAKDELREVVDFGNVAYDRDPRTFLTGPDLPPQPHERDYAEKTAATVDEEVRANVEKAFQRALDLLRERRAVLDRTARRLLETETLEEMELIQLVNPPESRSSQAAAE